MASKRTKTTAGTSGKRRASSSRGNHPCPHGFLLATEIQRARYPILAQRRILPTRYMDDTVLDTLGLREDFDWMLSRVGWRNFMTYRHETYSELTLEFLSSVEAHVLQGDEYETGRITFRLRDNDFSLTLAEFNAIFDLPPGGDRLAPRTFQPGHMWSQISLADGNYNPSNCKASFIPNPSFRYLHRIMANTLFGRGDSDGNVRADELLFIWSIINGHKLDTGAFLARHLQKVGNATSGTIVIGGLVTTIAYHFALDLADLQPLRGNTRLDLASCLATKMVVKQGNFYCLAARDGTPSLPLPNPPCTTMRTGANWLNPGAGLVDPIAAELPPGHAPEFQPGPSGTQGPSGPSSSSYYRAGAFSEPSEDAYGRLLASMERLHTGQEELLLRQEQLLAGQQTQQFTIDHMAGRVDSMYEWHMRQGHFPPNP